MSHLFYLTKLARSRCTRRYFMDKIQPSQTNRKKQNKQARLGLGLGLGLKRIVTHLLSVMLLFYHSSPFACTDFRIKAQDGTVLISRSMEFAVELKSNLRTQIQGAEYNTKTDDNTPGISWKTKYGYIYADAFGMDIASDGMNEKGLSFEYLYLPGDTQYPTVADGQQQNSLPYYYLGDWILGNFSSIDDIKNALTNVVIYGQKFASAAPEFKNVILPVHAAIYDATGQGIVVEFVAGKMNIYDNDVGILTNCPVYPWQITNLRNYLNLSPYSPDPITIDGITYATTGQGSGMLGLPGDVSPPSRFVKISSLLTTALPAKNADDAVNLAQHIINTVDIPLGFVRTKKDHVGNNFPELTQWVVFKDLKNNVLYYRTYNDMTLRKIALSQVDFTNKGPKLKMPMSAQPIVTDFTSQFVQSKS